MEAEDEAAGPLFLEHARAVKSLLQIEAAAAEIRRLLQVQS